MFDALIGGITDLLGGESANKANKQIAREQMYFQQRMSNSAHSREVEDLRRAGLNPILSAGGGGASTPPGASTRVENTVGKAVSTALETLRLKKEIKAADTSNKLNESLAETQKAIQATNAASAKKTNIEADILKSQEKAIKKKSDVDLKQENYREKFLDYDNWNQRLQQGTNTVNSALKILNPWKKGEWTTETINPSTGEIIKEQRRRGK